MIKLTDIFKNRGFFGLLAAHFFGIFNDNIFRTAFVSFVVYKIYALSAADQWFWMFLGLFFFIVPFFIFSAFAGEVGDKIGKDTVIKYAKLVELFVFVLFVVGLKLASVKFLIFVLCLKGMQSAFFSPVKYSILMDVVGKDSLLGANANFTVFSCIALFFGMVAGPYLVNTNIIIWLMGLSAVLGLLFSLLVPPVPIADPGRKISLNFIKINLLNFRLAFHSRDIFLCTLGIAWFWLCSSVLATQLQAFTIEAFSPNNKIFSYLLLVAAGDLACGAVGAKVLLKGEVNTRFAPLSVVLMTIFVVDLAVALSNVLPHAGVYYFSHFFWNFGKRICLDIFLAAFFGGIFIVPINAMLQAVAKRKVRTRMLAMCYLAITTFVVAGGVVSYSFISMGFSSSFILSILALMNVLFSIGIVMLLPKHIIRSVITTVLDFMYGIEINGLEEFRAHKKNAVIVANQNSLLDPLILAVFLPGRPFFAVETSVAKKFWIRPFLSLIRYYTVDPTNAMAVKSIIDEVKKGNKVVVFPEGRVSTTGGVMKIHPGLALIAERSGADIIPISIEGSQYSAFANLGTNLKNKGKTKITVNILPARKLKINEGLKSSQRRAAAENELYDIMTYMKFKSSKTDQTIFTSLIDSRYRMGYRFKFMEDIGRKEISFGTVITGAFVLGKEMSKKTAPGEYVGVMLPTTNACAITFLGLHAFSRVPAMINFSTGVKNVCDSCATAGIKTVYSAKKFVLQADMQPMVDALRASGVEVIYLDELKISIFAKLTGLLASFFPRMYYAFRNNIASPNDPAVLLFTSGSEGTPKAVALSHKNILSNASQVSSVIPFNYDDRMFCCMPLFHSFGLTGGFMVPLMCGFKVFFYPSPLHYHVIPQLVYETSSTILFATDTFLAGYAKTAHPYDFYSVRYVAIGAEKLKEENLNTWARKFGIRVLELYGATETSPGISVASPMHYNYGSVGRLLPGLEYRLDPVEGIEEGGRLVVKGDNVMLGYILSDNPGVIQPPKDGWYDTGDIVDVDEDGFIYIKGRAKRFAKVAGEMVPMLAVETQLSNLWPEAGHAIISIPDDKRGEQLVLYTTQAGAARADILKYFKEKGLPELFVPKLVKIIDAIPLTGSGKTNYVELTEKAKQEFGA
ncbi:acyl-[acyl-carrier-protein]-phospholipid O-acyltransferase/long-chain-fatty-acid--[acyl-carrier-protein] ligase [Elusimicrobium simillimum]|uniref:acyl-[ACP]--phospholipid O-acyltransferase n=1 Tax=Elusimicrobium simillimum TaxID=3143438 RepID=UPI003C6F235F